MDRLGEMKVGHCDDLNYVRLLPLFDLLAYCCASYQALRLYPVEAGLATVHLEGSGVSAVEQRCWGLQNQTGEGVWADVGQGGQSPGLYREMGGRVSRV
jgi:hypothetical protein